MAETKKIENSGFWTIDVKSGERKIITRELDGWYLNWSPDGKKFAFTAGFGGDEELWLMENFLPVEKAKK